jgi:general stress protein 26
MPETNELAKLIQLIRGFDTAMLVTHAPDGRLRARPMQVARVEDSAELWFLTGNDSPKVQEIQSDSHVQVVFQEERDHYVALAGLANLSHDRGKLDQLWKEGFKAWFPNGKDDPNICLIQVQPTEGEYWDNAGTQKIKYAIDSVRAYVTGDTPHIEEGAQHGRLSLS